MLLKAKTTFRNDMFGMRLTDARGNLGLYYYSPASASASALASVLVPLMPPFAYHDIEIKKRKRKGKKGKAQRNFPPKPIQLCTSRSTGWWHRSTEFCKEIRYRRWENVRKLVTNFGDNIWQKMSRTDTAVWNNWAPAFKRVHRLRGSYLKPVLNNCSSGHWGKQQFS